MSIITNSINGLNSGRKDKKKKSAACCSGDVGLKHEDTESLGEKKTKKRQKKKTLTKRRLTKLTSKLKASLTVNKMIGD